MNPIAISHHGSTRCQQRGLSPFTVGQQTHLGSVRASDESLHAVGLASCVAQFY